MSHTPPLPLPRALAILAGVALSVLVLPSCGSERGPDRRPEVITALATDLAVGRYRALEAQAGALVTAAEAFCAAPSESGLDATRAAWWAARTPWKEAEIVNFGPVVEFPERLGPKLDAWPASVTAIETMLTSDEGLTPEDFAVKGALKRGLPVVEYLLHVEGDGTLAAFESDPRRCAVLLGVARDVEVNAGALVLAWEQTWLARLTDPTVDTTDMWDTTQDVLDEWVNRMAFTVENIRADKLGRPLGDTSGGSPLPDTLESRYSARSLRDARDALAGVAAAFHGAGPAQPGVAALLERDPALVAQVTQQLVDADSALAAVPEPLEASLTGAPEAIVAAQEALRALQVTLQTDVAQALDVTIAFNDNDGD